jgi:hypothetical protein
MDMGMEVELNFVTIGYPAPAKVTSLRGPKIP